MNFRFIKMKKKSKSNQYKSEDSLQYIAKSVKNQTKHTKLTRQKI